MFKKTSYCTSVLTLYVHFINSFRRLGIQEGSTRAILDHPFFAKVDVEGIKQMRVVPEFIPSSNQHHEPLSSLMPVKPFHGDQMLFKEF